MSRFARYPVAYAGVANGPRAWMAIALAFGVSLLAGLVLDVDAFLLLVAAMFLLVVGLIVLVVQLESPILGLAVLVGTAVAFPLEFRGPAGVMMSSSFPLTAVLCGAWLLRLALVGRDALESSRVVYATLAFMGVSLLSFAMGQFPWFGTGGAPLPAQLAELGLFLLSAILFLTVGHQLVSLAQLKWLTWILIGAGVVAAVVQTMPDQLALVGRYTTRPGSIGSVFWTWLVALSVSQALFNRSLSPAVRACLLAINVLVFYHGLVQVRSWASGWAPPLMALGIIVLIRFPRFSVGLGLAGVPLVLLFGGDLITSILGEEDYSLSTRQGALETLWTLVKLSPLLGTGPANYYYLTENIPILGWYVRFISHNNYQDLLVQTGFVGLLVFGWFACEALWLTWRVSRVAPEGFARAYAIGALGGVAASLASGLLGDWIIPFYYNAGILGFRSSLLFWVFLGGVLAMRRLVSQHRDEDEVVERRAPRSSHGYRPFAHGI